MPRNTLRGRSREQDTLERVLRDVRAGHSRVLVLRGEAGVGKTALLDHLVAQARGAVVSSSAGVEPESEIAYAALQQLCAPLLGHLDALPEPQRRALATAFGLEAGDPPPMLLIGLAVLGLFAEAAAERPLVCVVDDVQWADLMSEVVLTFVARRLGSESVALVFSARSPGDENLLDGLPELRVAGLPDPDARALLDSVLPGPVDARVRDRIVAETRGNPLALLELPRDVSAAELVFGLGAPTTGSGAMATAGSGPRATAGSGLVPTVGSGPVATVEESFARRIAALPEPSRRLVLTAAVEPLGDVPLLWRALNTLGVGPEAAAAAEAAGLLEIGTRVRFRHPLVRSAIRSAADATELRDVHRALAEATDAARDPDRRAWHRAHAAVGPDEDVAADLERSADRALSRGGRAAAATFLERAASLTPDPARRAARAVAAARARLAAGAPRAVPELLATAELGPLDPAQRADVERLRAQAAYRLDRGRAATGPLLAAADRLAELDVAAARETYLSALGAAVHAGSDDQRRAALAARALPAGNDAAGLLLTGLATWSLDGYRPAVGPLRDALDALRADADLPMLWIAAPVADELWDDAAAHRLTERAVVVARATGDLSLLPTALAARAGALLVTGRFAEASDLLAEAVSLGEATWAVVPPAAGLLLAACTGRDAEAGEAIDTVTRDAAERGEGRTLALAGYATAVLRNGLGHYAAALTAAREASGSADLGVYGPALSELVEAAVRAGDGPAAAQARERLAERTSAADTDWARGTQAVADALAGPAADAEAHYREAARRLSGGRLELPLARARLLYGEWLRRENRRSDARVELRAAADAFTTMGAEGFAARARQELLATGETARKRTDDTRDDLTPQEARIARLVTSGKTNAEIGAELFLSARTVEWHLRKVFGKLGVTSRRELTRRAPSMGALRSGV